MALSPEEIVQVSILHVLKDHHEGLSVGRNAVESDDVRVVQAGEELRFPIKVFAQVLQTVVLEGLDGDHGEVVRRGEALAQTQVHAAEGTLPQLAYQVNTLVQDVTYGSCTV